MVGESAPARLRKRAEFLRAAKGARLQARLFSLQAAARPAAEAGPARTGLTVTKRVGGAVERNRIRRRLRAALRLTADLPARPDHDYVIVARREALAAPFEALRADLARAFGAVHKRDMKRREARRP